jgi:hypothetical protein
MKKKLEFKFKNLKLEQKFFKIKNSKIILNKLESKQDKWKFYKMKKISKN